VRPSLKPAIEAARNPFRKAPCFENTSQEGPRRRGRSLTSTEWSNRNSPFSWPKVSIGHVGLTTKCEIEGKSFVIRDLTHKSFRFKDRPENLLLTP
jgi:hypothetical protein